MKTVSKSMLKPKMLEYFREVEETGEPLIVTNHNQPVLKIEPIKQKQAVSDIFAPYWGKVHIPKDITKPETDEWGEV